MFVEIARTLDEATPALDFEIPLPAGDERYVDFSAVRGSGSVARLRTLLKRQPPDRRLHAVFASHRGAGKSTELLHLMNDVRDQYYSIYFEANVELDAVEFSMEELLLVIARVVEERMRERDTPIRPELLKKVEDWFAEVVFTDEEGRSYLAGVHTEAKAEGGIPFFAKLLASLTAGFKVESHHKKSVKNTLQQFPGTLLTHVNNLLNDASGKLEQEGKRLLIIIDNMDRYAPAVIDRLLVESPDRFKQLRAHLIVTPLMTLLVRPESQSIRSVFKCETMPTVKLREPHESYGALTAEGSELLRNVLGQRIDLARLIPDEAAQNRLIATSGGAVRELLEMAQDASLDATGEAITMADIELALNRRRSLMRDMIDNNGWWDVLAEIAQLKKLDHDPAFLTVVFHRLAFQYNGTVWYDVHPLVAELLSDRGLLKKSSKEKVAKKKAAAKRVSRKAKSE